MTELPNYEHPDHIQFVEDMQAASFKVRHYGGRFFWTGPAVEMAEPQDWPLYTSVKCQYDNLGQYWFVYPQAYDAEGLEKVQDYINSVGVDFVSFIARLGPSTGIVLPGVNDCPPPLQHCPTPKACPYGPVHSIEGQKKAQQKRPQNWL